MLAVVGVGVVKGFVDVIEHVRKESGGLCLHARRQSAKQIVPATMSLRQGRVWAKT